MLSEDLYNENYDNGYKQDDTIFIQTYTHLFTHNSNKSFHKN